jgi:hypothetical protein
MEVLHSWTLMSVPPRRSDGPENRAAPIQPRTHDSGGHAINESDPPPRRSRRHAVSTAIARRWIFQRSDRRRRSHAQVCRSAGTSWPGSSGRTGLNRSRPAKLDNHTPAGTIRSGRLRGRRRASKSWRASFPLQTGSKHSATLWRAWRRS